VTVVALKLHPGGLYSCRVAENGGNPVLGERGRRNMLQGEPPRGVLLPARDEGDSAAAWSTYDAGVLFVVDHQEQPVGGESNGIRWCGWRVWLPFVWFFFGNPEGKGEVSPLPPEGESETLNPSESGRRRRRRRTQTLAGSLGRTHTE
jgi:hypothetical protein